MAKPTESRYAQILKSKIREGESFMSAASSARSERLREQADLRRLLPKSGILGALAESTFGKAYQYRRTGKPMKDSVSSEQSGMNTKTLNVIRVNTAITAKNSMVLPGMARDMNVMRQNIGRMTSKMTGNAASRADMHFLKAKERESAYEVALKGGVAKEDTEQKSSTPTKSKGLLGSLGGILGGGLAIGGSIISGLVSGLGSVLGIVGSIGSGMLGVIGSAVSSMGIMGVIALAGSAYMIAQMSKSGMFNFGSVSAMLGIKPSADGKGIFEDTAEKLDSYFKTDDFTKTLHAIKTSVESAATATMAVLGNLSGMIGKYLNLAILEMKNVLMQFSKEAMMVMAVAVGGKSVINAITMGALRGGAVGAVGAGLGALVLGGAAYNEMNELSDKIKMAMVDSSLNDEQRTVLKDIDSATERHKDFIAKMREVSEIKAKGGKLQGLSRVIGGITQEKRKGGLLPEDPNEALAVLRQNMIMNDQDKGIEPTDLHELNRRYKKAFGVDISGSKADYADTIMKNELEKARKEVDDIRLSDITKGVGSSKSPSKITNRDMANHIYFKFREAGFTHEQALAAVANAQGESGLNPNATNIVEKGGVVTEESYGLFQMNRKGGLGAGHKPEDLMNADYNIGLAIEAAKKSKSFMSAKSTSEAISAFVNEVERPADKQKAIQDRIAILDNSLNIKENTEATKTLTDTLKEKAEDSMESILAALFETMSSMSTGTGSVNNINNNTINAPVASPYNEDYYPLIFRNVTEGR